ncbi:MAG: helix-turn-helix transcriptional regulator [Blastochloris sp.]|nr:helix-turn-helix transcriptional regulator [Blastochloris sp.]
MIMLATKLFIPPPRPNALPRATLTARLQAGLHRRLTLIAAPAGFGKTSLASAWVGTCGRPAAWLSLDEADSGPARFLSYLVAALQTLALSDVEKVVPPIGADVAALLRSAQPPRFDALLALLLNQIATLPQPALLVLDDCHVLAGGPIDQLLAMLVDHLPPQLHLVLITREDPALPLARLRARDQITEVRAADLRFSTAEAATFLTEVMGLTLSEHAIATLEARTEGWVAGLQLAALSLQGHPDAAGFVRSFSGHHRFVLDYLLDEVLRRQPAPIQQFLLRTAILDRLCGSLCDAILHDDGGTAHSESSPAILAQLERANLFLVPLDDERRWYRYHHLFGELLRQRLPHDSGLSEAAIAGLHLCASAWFEAHDLLPEALHHAAAADSTRLAALAERSWQQMDHRFQSVAWLRWVQHLPETILQERPVLCLQYASALSDAGDIAGSAARLQEAERWLEPKDTTEEPVVEVYAQFATLPSRIALIRAYNAQAQGDVAAAVQQAVHALAHLDHDPSLLRAQVMALLSLSYWAAGDLDAAQRALDVWIASTREAGNLAFTLASQVYLVEILFAQGQLHVASRRCRQLLEQVPADDAAAGMAVPHLHLQLAMIAHEQGAAPAAACHLQMSEEASARGSLVDWPFRRYLLQARVQELAGNWESALDLLDEAGRRFVKTPVPNLHPVAALKARVHLRKGNLAAAQAWAAETGLTPADKVSYIREFEHLTLVRLLLARARRKQGDDELPAACSLLARLFEAAETAGRIGSMIEILLLQSLICEVRGDIPQACITLEHALILAQPAGYLRLFVDEGPPLMRLLGRMRDAGSGMQAYVSTLLNAFGSQAVVHPASDIPPPLPEPLTTREIEILHLIAAGLSNQEIAVRLHLSPQTVKVHTRNIYGKLGVSSRTQAVARGRALGMLEPQN